MRVLGIDVPAPLLARWRTWLAPDPQPFFLTPSDIEPPGATDGEMTLELRDTFRTYALDRDLTAVWLSERSFGALQRPARARLVRAQVNVGRGSVPIVRRWTDLLDPQILKPQADGHRFVWWPSLLAHDDGTILERVVREGRSTSRHSEVKAATWSRCATLLPRARALAGTFPSESGPNCFTTVLDASGEVEAAMRWGVREPFDEWLAHRTRPGGDDERAGTVLVWRNREGLSDHAAVTIGDGWALEKPSQDWHAPRVVRSVRELIDANRVHGRLERRTRE